MPDFRARKRGPRGATSASLPSSWKRFPSAKLTITSRSSSATPTFTGGSTRTNRRSNSRWPSRLAGYPIHMGSISERRVPEPPALAEGRPPFRSGRASGLNESVIREMTRLAIQHNAVNLAQGYPDFPAPDFLKRAAIDAIEADINQYSITWGAKPFRDAIAA